MGIVIRRSTIEDSYACFQIFLAAIDDLGRRTGTMGITGGTDPKVLAELWERRRSLFEHLAQTAEYFFVAERDSKLIAYARSIMRGGMRELTEFFVMPNEQSAGLGKELLAKVFPTEGAENRIIIATLDTRAQIRYMKAGIFARFPISEFSCAPKAVEFSSDLSIIPINESPENLDALATIDKAVLSHNRNIDHQWLLKERQGFLYSRNNELVGYGYVGYRSGPFALLNAADFPAILAHAETEASKHYDYFGLEIPMMNHHAMSYVLQRGYELDSFYAFFMSEKAFGNFENYIFTSPPIFM